MPNGDVETYFADDMWSNKIEGGEKVGNYQTKDRAVEAGRELARERSVEHIVRNQDGTIADRSSYGNDPRNVPAESRAERPDPAVSSYLAGTRTS